ncbi:Metalloenzyme, LuxS/M16 peptidase-like protein [Scenedesmus sp. NREL 46B-D3]|nr:Metalloenzyme, LuxS/M16 peptidase-like protein [Scenedesmus sp. NREL 46B-D3]
MHTVQQRPLALHRPPLPSGDKVHRPWRMPVHAAALQQQHPTSSRFQPHWRAADASANLPALPLACAFTFLQLLDGSAQSHAAAATAHTEHRQQQQSAALELYHHLQLLQLPSAPQLLSPPAAELPLSDPASPAPAATAAANGEPSGSTSGPGDVPATSSQLPPLPTDFPPLPKLQQPKIYQEVLLNGLRVSLLEDREVPLITGSLLMPGGQVSSPAEHVGLASITAAVQRSGGSRAHPVDVLDERLEDLAASIEASAGQQSTTFDFQCMSGDVQEVLGLLTELLQQPALPADKLSMVQAQVANIISHRDDDASSVARRELYKLLYGQDSIYARTPTTSGVTSLTPADLAAHIAVWQRPDGAILGLVGDFSSSDMMATVKDVLGSWSPALGQPAAHRTAPHEDLPDLPAVLAAAAAAAGNQQQQQQPQVVYVVDRPGAEQASVYAGEPGISLSDPDCYALDVLAATLNGFGGTLFDELRTRQGLAYSVAASWDSPVDHRGLFLAAAETVQPARFIQELSSVLTSVRVEPPTQQALLKAKAGLLNSFVFNFASSYSQLQRTLVFQLLGLPPVSPVVWCDAACTVACRTTTAPCALTWPAGAGLSHAMVCMPHLAWHHMMHITQYSASSALCFLGALTFAYHFVHCSICHFERPEMLSTVCGFYALSSCCPVSCRTSCSPTVTVWRRSLHSKWWQQRHDTCIRNSRLWWWLVMLLCLGRN